MSVILQFVLALFFSSSTVFLICLLFPHLPAQGVVLAHKGFSFAVISTKWKERSWFSNIHRKILLELASYCSYLQKALHYVHKAQYLTRRSLSDKYRFCMFIIGVTDKCLATSQCFVYLHFKLHYMYLYTLPVNTHIHMQTTLCFQKIYKLLMLDSGLLK